jgi:NADH dehydrogenase
MKRRTTTVQPAEGDAFEESFDTLVVALGAIARTAPVPGLVEHAVGFKTIDEAIHLRNGVLACLEAAAEATDPNRRRALLTFVFVGGGYAGVEALAELEDLCRAALKRYPELDGERPRWVLVEATGRILPETNPRLAEYALRRLTRRGIEIHLETRLDSAEHGVMKLSNGGTFPAATLVWTTGVRPDPMAERSGLPVDERGRVTCDEFLRVRDADGDVVAGVWAAGDSAAVPDLTTGGLCPPTAQHALRQAKRLASNIAASRHGRPVRPFKYHNRGQLVSLGRYRGVAQLPGHIRLRGLPAWWLHRSYHVAMMPTLNRKVRICLDWTVALFFPRDVVALGSLQRPRKAFQRAAAEEERRAG